MEKEIEELIKLKQDAISELQALEKDREEHLGDAARKQIILKQLEAADRVNLWTDEGREAIRKEHAYLSKLLNIERFIRIELNKLNQIEHAFYLKLQSNEIAMLPQLKRQLLEIISEKDDSSIVSKMGILQLITMFFNTHEDEINWEAEIGRLLTEDDIKELIFGKFRIVAADWGELIIYNNDEKNLLSNLKNRISSQNRILKAVLEVQAKKTSPTNHEADLLQDVIHKGATLLNTCLPAHYSQRSSGGYQDINSPKAVGGSAANVMGYLRFYPQIDTLKNNGINETIFSQPIFEDVYGDVPTKVPGRFGIGSKTEVKRQKIGQRPVLHKQRVNGGSDEEAYSLGYYASDCRDERLYPVYDGRFSNYIILQIILPKSIAEKVWTYLEQNPKFVRIMAQEMIINDIEIPRQAWINGDEYTRYPLRPPYEKWSQKADGCKIYIQEPGSEHGFNPNFVKIIQ